MFSQFIQNVENDKRLEQCQIFDNIFFSSLNSETLAILLTPICDLVNDEVDHLIFCGILPYKEYFFKYVKTQDALKDIDIYDTSLSQKRKNQFLAEIKNIIGNRFERFHWLGKLQNQEGYWYVDYQLIQTFHISEKESLVGKRLFELDSPLNQSVSVRFSNYLGRIGLPVEKEQKNIHAGEVFEYLRQR